MTATTSFDRAVWRVLAERQIEEGVAAASCTVVILERHARAAGSVAWFRCSSPASLRDVVNEFRPGSCVSFYLDGQISIQRAGPDLRESLLSILHRTGAVLVGLEEVDGIHIAMHIPVGDEELDETLSTLGEDSIVYVGPYPGRDDDGRRAITLLIPDSDGVVRQHPH